MSTYVCSFHIPCKIYKYIFLFVEVFDIYTLFDAVRLTHSQTLVFRGWNKILILYDEYKAFYNSVINKLFLRFFQVKN